MKELFNEDNWVEEFRDLMSVGELWYFFKTEAAKPVMNELFLTKLGREKDSMPVWVNNYLKKNAKIKQAGCKEQKGKS